jgi:hypothetical protein
LPNYLGKLSARLTFRKRNCRNESEANVAEPKPKDKDRDEKDESFKKFEDLTDKLLRVPKKEVDKLREREKQEREKKRAG